MKTIKIAKKLLKNTKTFEFSAPYKIKADGNFFEEDDMGRVRTKLIIDYLKRKYRFDDGRYHLETSTGEAVGASFKRGDDLDRTFEKMFNAARSFAKKEIAKIKKR